MKKIIIFLCMLILALMTLSSYAADKVVVVPLNTSKGGPGDWKHVSVSSMGAIPRTSSVATEQGTSCNSAIGSAIGRYTTTGTSEFMTVPIELPDGATITAFTAVICDNTSSYSGSMYLYRSDSVSIASTGTSVAEASITPFTKTTTTISAGREVVDNSQYAYFVYMEINGVAGSSLSPISAIVTLK